MTEKKCSGNCNCNEQLTSSKEFTEIDGSIQEAVCKISSILEKRFDSLVINIIKNEDKDSCGTILGLHMEEISNISKIVYNMKFESRLLPLENYEDFFNYIDNFIFAFEKEIEIFDRLLNEMRKGRKLESIIYHQEALETILNLKEVSFFDKELKRFFKKLESSIFYFYNLIRISNMHFGTMKNIDKNIFLTQDQISDRSEIFID
jgi:hypothetical protein